MSVRLLDRMSGRALRETSRFLVKARYRRENLDIGGEVVFYGTPIIEIAKGAVVTIGDRSVLCSRSRHTGLGVSRPVILRALTSQAEIDISEDCGLSGTTIAASRLVRIGARTLLGADVVVVDTDFHPIEPAAGRRFGPLPQHQPGSEVIIGHDVFIGMRSIVLKGTHIGDGTVIGAGSVVSGKIPAGVVAAGNPCKVLRELKI